MVRTVYTVCLFDIICLIESSINVAGTSACSGGHLRSFECNITSGWSFSTNLHHTRTWVMHVCVLMKNQKCVLVVFIFVSRVRSLTANSGAARSGAASLSNAQRRAHFKIILQSKRCESTNHRGAAAVRGKWTVHVTWHIKGVTKQHERKPFTVLLQRCTSDPAHTELTKLFSVSFEFTEENPSHRHICWLGAFQWFCLRWYINTFLDMLVSDAEPPMETLRFYRGRNRYGFPDITWL